MADVAHHQDEIDGVPVSWHAAPGEGTPAVYVHGVPNSSLMWRPFLARTGGVALDLPGFGDSVKAVTFPYSLAGYDGYMERFLDWLGLDRIDLVVHDWGAAALGFAARQPERIGRLVVINALPLFEGYQWHRAARLWRLYGLGELLMGSISLRMVRRAVRNANVKGIPEPELREMYTKLDFGTQRAILKLHRSVRTGALAAAGAQLRHIEAPALIVWGAADPFIPERFAESYAQALGGPTELERLTDAGHWPWLDRPDVIERVARFLTDDTG